jgi:hypothetical protein
VISWPFQLEGLLGGLDKFYKLLELGGVVL